MDEVVVVDLAVVAAARLRVNTLSRARSLAEPNRDRLREPYADLEDDEASVAASVGAGVVVVVDVVVDEVVVASAVVGGDVDGKDGEVAGEANEFNEEGE